jgi:hypothetical protein
MDAEQSLIYNEAKAKYGSARASPIQLFFENYNRLRDTSEKLSLEKLSYSQMFQFLRRVESDMPDFGPSLERYVRRFEDTSKFEPILRADIAEKKANYAKWLERTRGESESEEQFIYKRDVSLMGKMWKKTMAGLEEQLKKFEKPSVAAGGGDDLAARKAEFRAKAIQNANLERLAKRKEEALASIGATPRPIMHVMRRVQFAQMLARDSSEE